LPVPAENTFAVFLAGALGAGTVLTGAALNGYGAGQLGDIDADSARS